MKTPYRFPVLMALVAALVLAAVAAACVLVWSNHEDDRADALAHAGDLAQRLSLATANRVDAAVRSVDVVLRESRRVYTAEGAKIEAIAPSLLRALPAEAALQLSITDGKGSIVYSSVKLPGPTNIGGGPAFEAARRGDDRLLIGAPFRGLVSRSWVVPLIRPIHRNGGFDGIVAATISAEYLGRILTEFEIEPQHNISLFDLEGRYIARNRLTSEALGRNVTPGRPFVGADPPARGTFRAKGTIGNDERLFAWTRIPDTRLVAVVGISTSFGDSDIERRFRANSVIVAVSAALLLLLGAGLIALLHAMSRQQRAVAESEARYRALTEISTDWHWEIDENLKVVRMEGAGVGAIGEGVEELFGRTVASFPEFKLLSMGPEEFAALRAARKPYRDVRARVDTRDGRAVYLSITGSPMFAEDGRFVGYRGSTRNITQQVELENSLRDLTENLERRVQARTQELEAALKELDAFAYSVSHDLRAPLRAIGSFAHLVREREAQALTEDGRRRLGIVEANAVRMGQLVDELLALARLSRAPLERQAVDVHAIAAAVAGDLQPQYPAAKIELGALPSADADPTLLRQVLENLMGNALKYSAKRPDPRVEVAWHEASRAYAVRDNGAGFDMRYAGKLFGAFERLHPESEFPGIGIGLAIVKRAVERHGGRVWAESAPGMGATFYFTLGAATA